MKKKTSVFLATVMAICSMGLVTANAKVGDVIGQALHTDIVAYVNHYAIPSYAVNGTSVVVAEDLRNFGFDVIWNDSARSLSIVRNSSTSVNEMSFKKEGRTGQKFTDILETDISVYGNGRRLTSYAMNGYTMIPVEELTMFGEVAWVEGERALKLWVDGLNVRSAKQAISTGYTAPSQPSTPTYSNSPFSSLKSAIMSKGKYDASSMAYTYVVPVEADLFATVSYDVEDDAIVFSGLTSSDSGTSFSMVQIDNDEDEVWGAISISTSYGDTTAIYEYINGNWITLSDDFPASMASNAKNTVMKTVELFDIVLQAYFGTSLGTFGVYY